MIVRLSRQLVLAFVLGAVLAGCREDLTAPGSCPATCPGGIPVVRDTFLDAVPGADSTYLGYFTPGETKFGLTVANGLNGRTSYGVVRFIKWDGVVSVRDTARTYTIDSVVLIVPLLARDTMISGIVLEVHRLPATLDTSNTTFATVDPEMGAATLIDSITIADSILRTINDTLRSVVNYRFVLDSADLAKVAIPPADSGVLALGFSISGATATGVRIAGIGSSDLGGIPLFRTYVTVDLPPADTAAALKFQMIQRATNFTTQVSSSATPMDPDLLAPGGDLGARAMIRFPWPAYLRDSVHLVRATLELVPESAFTGLPGDSTYVVVKGTRVDFGKKSPVPPLSLSASAPTPLGSTDTVLVNVTPELQFWQGDRPHPPLLFLLAAPEGGSFTEPRFFSTRSPSGHPRIRVTYQVPFDFGRP